MYSTITTPFSSHLEFALSEKCAELYDFLCCDGITVRPVFGHFILQCDEADGRTLLLLQAKELQDALVVIHIAVDEDEQDLDREDVKIFILIIQVTQNIPAEKMLLMIL